jgi:cytochrome b561
LFGALLCGSVVARFYLGVYRAPRVPAAGIRMLSRRLSRRVYLVLYVLMFFSLTIDILRGESHRSMLRSAESFQSYLVCGVAALVTIHVLAALCHRFVIRDDIGAPLQMVQRNGRLT